MATVMNRKLSEDGDEFWGDSEARKELPRRNIFDDDVSFEKAKKILTASQLNDDVDEEEDLVTWTGEPCIKYTTPTNTNANQFGLNKVKMTPELRVSSNDLEDVVHDAFPSGRKPVAPPDVEKLQKEIIFLRKELQIAKRERWNKTALNEVVRKMVLGQPFTLELYKSKEDKEVLLDKAIASCDGNAIIAAVLFLKKTLKTSLFNLYMRTRPVAVNHYVSYLKQHFDHTQLVDFLGMLGRMEEAAIYKYKIACQTKDPSLRISCLKSCYRSHFSDEPGLARQSAAVQEHISLLERQRPVEEADANAEASGQAQIFKDFPRRASLFDQPVTTSLYYCCLYHYDLKENSLASPQALKAHHQISDKQFLMTAIGARAKVRRWKEVEALLTVKGWFGGTQLRALIGFEKVAEILYKHKSPHDVLSKYVGLIEDLDQRLTIAKRVECPKAVIDTLVAMKDRSQLEAYTGRLRPQSPEALYGYDALRNSTIKWK